MWVEDEAIFVRTRMPIDDLGTYRITIRVKQIKANSNGGEDSFYCGVVGVDHNGNYLSTDKAYGYNYGVAINNQTMKSQLGQTKTFTVIFQDSMIQLKVITISLILVRVSLM